MAASSEALSDFTTDEIDELYLRVCRGPNKYITAEEISILAITFCSWINMFQPYTEQQKPFFKAEPLLDAVKSHADSYYTWAVYVIGTPSPTTYYDLLRLDPAKAEEYQEYCMMYVYLNVAANPYLSDYIETVEDNEVSEGREVTSGSVPTCAGDKWRSRI